MANRGSFTHTRGDPIYAIEITYHDGDTSLKTYASVAGLKRGITEIDRDIKRWPGHGPKSRQVFITKPRWHLFDPDNP